MFPHQLSFGVAGIVFCDWVEEGEREERQLREERKARSHRYESLWERGRGRTWRGRMG